MLLALDADVAHDHISARIAAHLALSPAVDLRDPKGPRHGPHAKHFVRPEHPRQAYVVLVCLNGELGTSLQEHLTNVGGSEQVERVLAMPNLEERGRLKVKIMPESRIGLG